MGDEVVGVHLTLELERRLERERHAGWEKQEKGGLRKIGAFIMMYQPPIKSADKVEARWKTAE